MKEHERLLVCQKARSPGLSKVQRRQENGSVKKRKKGKEASVRGEKGRRKECRNC